MPYITSVERMGMEKGHEKGLAEGRAQGVRDSIRTVLVARFGDGCLEQLGGLAGVSDPSQLSSLTLVAATAATFEEFFAALSGSRSPANEA